MNNFYNITDKVVKLYSLLQDDLSKEIFWARLKTDISPTMESLLALYKASGVPTQEELSLQETWKEKFSELTECGKKIILYGAGREGKCFANAIWNGKQDFYGFCDKNSHKFPNGYLNKPVISTEELFRNKDIYYVIISTACYTEEIASFLRKNDFPEDHILPYFSMVQSGHKNIPRPYFDFPELYTENTVFVDAGCFNGQDSVDFTKFCKGKYSKILAFEPEISNIAKCKEALSDYRDVEIFNKGLGNECKTVRFSSEKTASHIVAETENSIDYTSVDVITLDSVTGNCDVGFIKMDIEGAEMDALRGAQNTIVRDKPMIAVSVYHRAGDVLEIMSYLNSLNLDYRFWLRHYFFSSCDTVLYAAV